ncbi:coiled-coil domain-containing protein 141 [Seriola lalandi dorsalis]|uniref:coiled-coil domain-containing protein 141 n=1 Tax=Seriola lalandi dorsalis TaxID=1841481 RepID=UPI000C6FA38E|nr:coiled-coil domain-containing protein 141 [Seriola lalandi dorsalis]
MTTGETEETCGGQEKAGGMMGGRGGGGGNATLAPSFTTLSTIAIQAGQSQIVVSVLRSGLLVHLQLVQFHPGLCEIGLNQEENQRLIQEQQQLLEKLKRHESEVLAVVENGRQTEQRRKRREERMTEQKWKKKKEEEEEVYKAMGVSLSEGWSLLLRLLQRRQEVLMLASDFYRRALEDWTLTVYKLLAQDLQSGSRSDLGPESKSDLKSGSNLDVKLRLSSQKTRDLQPGSREDVRPGSGSETRNLELGVRSDLKPESGSDLKPGIKSDVKLGSRSHRTRDVDPEFRSEETRNSRSQSRPDLKLDFLLEGNRDLQSGFKSDVPSGSRSDLLPGSRPEETSDIQPASKPDVKSESRSDLKPRSRSVEIRDLRSGFRLNLKVGSTSDLKSDSKSEETRDLQPASKPDVKPESKSDLKPRSRSEENKDLQPESRSEKTVELQLGSRSDIKRELRSDLKPRSNSEKTRNLQPGSRADLESDSTSEETRSTLDLKTGSRSEETRNPGAKSQSPEDHAHQSLLTNQKQELLSSCEHLVDKVWSWVQQGSSVLSNSSEAGRQLHEAEDTLNTHLQLQTQAESAGHDAQNLKQILDQIQAQTSRASPQRPSEPSRQLSPLKALTEQLKRGSSGRDQTRAGAARPGPPAAGSPSPELAGRVDLVLKELESLNRKIDSNLQLLKPYVTFLHTAQQVEEEMEELREIYRRRPEEEEEREAGRSNIRTTSSSRSPLKKKQVQTCWEETLQRLVTAQELGNNYVHTVTLVSGAGLDLQSVVSVVQRIMEKLNRTKQEVNKLRGLHDDQVQQHQQLESCRMFRHRLLKTLQDLKSVSELLDSCSLLDLGSDLQTSKLLEHFSQARPHFMQLDAEVDHMMKSWETLRGVQDRLEVKGGAVTEEDLSELLNLQKRVKDKIQQSESILDVTSSFHLTVRRLEALLHSDPADPSTGPTGSGGSAETQLNRHKEEQQQIQNLFKTASALKTDICTAVTHSEAARREERLRREQLTRLLNDDINQLRDSFKELKKRFNNLKFNYLKRNDRTRNTKAVRNQLQQMKLYEEKLQVLRKRLQGVTARLGSEVKDGGVIREVEDAINELQRQMGEFERSLCEHQKTLDMTSRLQQAMEEYQFWCEEASATIARVGKFSSECRSTEAVSVLHRQFEKFVWPTVPQQEERISQITELAVRLHGSEEGRRYIEKTVSKHSEMVESIRELSDGLMELEAKLKLESLKQQPNDREKEMKEEGEMERRRESQTEEKDEEKENKLKENRKRKKKEQTDNRSTQEAADMYELKETGHTPELTDGKEVPMKRQTAANRKPPLQKNRSQEADRQTVISESRQQRSSSSYCSTHTFSLSCSPVEPNRRVHTIHSQLQSVDTEPLTTPPPSVIGPSFSDVQRDFQSKEMQETGQQDAGGLSEAELQQQDVMTEDSLSNDEYECVSPDDISLPPLAETPESSMLQSDMEEGFCFSSHSLHVSQYSRQSHVQSEHSGTGTATGAVQQQRESSQTEGDPSPPTGRHSSTRFRSESTLFVQSPLAAPAPSRLTSTLCTILRTEETSTANFSQTVDIPKPSFVSGSNPVRNSNTTDSCYMENEVPDRKTPSKTEPLNDHNTQYNQPQRRTGTQGKSSPNLTSKSETLPKTDPITQPPFNGPDPDLPRDKTPQEKTRIFKCGTTFPQTRNIIGQDKNFTQSFPHSETGLNPDTNSSQIREETSLVSKPQRDSLTNTSTVTQQPIYIQSSTSDTCCALPQSCSSLSSPYESPLSQSKTMPSINPVPQARGFTQSHGFTDSALHKDSNLPQDIYPDSRSGLDLDVPSPQTSKESSSLNMPQNSNLTTTTSVSQQSVYYHSSPSDSRCNVSQARNTFRSKQESPFTQASGDVPNLPEPNSVDNISMSSSSITSSNRFSSKQSHQTVYSLHESLTSTCTKQCVHDPGMTPSSSAKPAAPPPSEAQTQALAQQANPHVTPPSSLPHLLTSDQDPDICQPMAIREEIRLTPQIQGPPLPVPPLPQAQAESLPQGKASKLGPLCFTRPLSRATVMGGSPVMLEVELTGHPEHTLTWFKDGDMSATNPGPAAVREDRKHFLFNTKTPSSDGGINQARVANHHDSQQTASNSSSSDKCLVAEVFDIISTDWQTWFGTLCVLLWLLYLILL